MLPDHPCVINQNLTWDSSWSILMGSLTITPFLSDLQIQTESRCAQIHRVPHRYLAGWLRSRSPASVPWRPGGGASPTHCMSHSCSRFVLLAWTQTLREAGCLPFSGTAPWEAPPGTGRPSPLGRGSQMHHLPMFSPFPSWSLPLPLPSSLSEMTLDKYHSFQYRQCKTTPIKSTESNTWTCTVST